MNTKQLSRTEILRMIETGTLSAEKGFAMLHGRKQQTDVQTGYFRTVWELAEIATPASSQVPIGNVLILDNDGQTAEWLQQHMSSREGEKGQVVLVQPGERYRKLGDNSYQINLQDQADYLGLLQELQTQGTFPSKIVHAWSKDDEIAGEAGLVAQLKRGIYSVFFLSKALIQLKVKEKVRMLYLYPGSQENLLPHCAAVAGFAKSLHLEQPQLFLKTVALTGVLPDQLVGAVLAEAMHADGRHEVRYERGKRYVKKLQEVPVREDSCQPVVLKENGVYLITGGVGGLGLIFAEHLAKQGKATIILTGRSQLDQERVGKIRGIQASGAEVVYLQADIADRDEVRKLFDQIQKRFGSVDGIIHSAGVLRDGLVNKKSREDLEAVIAAKVMGTYLLDEATKDKYLSFFVLFSSVAGEFGNAGQADYAFANAYLDAFAEQREEYVRQLRRSGRTLSINWPLWAEGGMQIDEQAMAWLESSVGAKPLAAQQGVKAFWDGLQSEDPQRLVLSGEIGRIREFIGRDKSVQMNKAANESTAEKGDQLQEKTEHYLRSLLSKQTKIPLQKIRTHVALESYGIDSMIIMNVTRALEKDFGPLSKTLFFEYQTIAELAAYFIQHHRASTLQILDFNSSGSEIVRTTPAKAADNRAPVVVKRKQAEPDRVAAHREVAIVGVSGRYPMADTLEEFWTNLQQGKDCITEIPADRWDHRPYFDPGKKKKGKSYSKWGGFINDADKFDPLFFHISPREAELMDPQERLFLETVWHTLEDAGCTRKQLGKRQVGVFVGVMYGQYQLYGADEERSGSGFVPASSYASIANRVSYFFDFHGPSMAIDTMCSSSLTAIHLGYESIRRGECEVAIAGGVNITVHPNKYLQLSEGNFASTDGRCRSFGEGGDGYVPGEGVGAVLLKPLDQAIEDGDAIYAVIKGSSLNHGGKTNGYTVPNPNAQAELIAEALRQADVNPRHISYLEAHGTGTSLGDPIEITGLIKAYRKSTQDKQFSPIGSVKSNIGHLESASGIAGLTKVLLQMKYRQLVPSLHSQTLNPHISFAESPFYVQRELTEWKTPTVIENGVTKQIPRIAGISSFGAGGSNAHLIVEEYPNATLAAEADRQETVAILLSAKNRERLREYAGKLLAFLEGEATGTSDELSGHDLREWIENELLTQAIFLMGVDGAEMSATDYLDDYGFDAVFFSQLAVRINEKFHVELNPVIFSEYPTVSLLAGYLIEIHGGHIQKQYESQIGKKKTLRRDVRLTDIAYTLQVGREEMEERLAAIVSSKEELAQKLQEYLAGNADVDGLYTGNTREEQFRSQELFSGEAGEAFLRMIAEKRELPKLAQIWVAGVDVDWSALYQGALPKKISLPTYPFARERFWVPAASGQKGEIFKLHPLVDRNISTLREIKFSKQIQGDERYLQEVPNLKQKILPGAAMIEMARAAGMIAADKHIHKVQNVVWGSPLAIGNGSLDVQISFYPNRDFVEYEVSSKISMSEAYAYSQGTMYYGEEPAREKSSEYIELDMIKQRCHNRRARTDEPLAPTQKGISTEIFSSEEEALVRFAAAEQLNGISDRVELSLAVFAATLESAALLMKNEEANLLPLSVNEVVYLKPLESEGFVHVVTNTANSGDTWIDARIVDNFGKVLIQMNRLRVSVAEMLTETAGMTVQTAAGSANIKSAADLRKLVEKDILQTAASILKMDADKLEPEGNFGEFGFDSVALKDYADQLAQRYSIEITPTVFFSKASIRELSGYLVEEFGREINEFYQTANQTESLMVKQKGTAEPAKLTSLAERYEGLRVTTEEVKAGALTNQEPVAIIGMSGMFPQSKDLEEFWKYLEAETDLISEVPIERWDWRDYHIDYVAPSSKIKTRSKWGGYLPEVDKFDPRFFHISPLEAEMMDPQQRLFLETVWKTIEDGGYKPSDFSGRRVGLFAGIQFSDYQQLLASQGELNAQMGLGNEHSIFVNRISYLLNLHGPSEPYNTACSSSGVAIHRAVRSIRGGECELAIAGGISLMLSPYTMISSDQLGILSPDGRCKTLDKSANGYVKGEGVGALLLKPLSKAIEDRDHIYAVIKGTAVNHGGKAASLTAPNAEAQADLLVDAYQDADMDPSTVSYLELHGTGTELGDPVEIEGIKKAFSVLAKRREKMINRHSYCGIGSVKTNIGHLEPASGIAGMMKVILSMKHEKLPGILHLKELNPYVEIKNTPLYIVERTKRWERLTDDQGREIPRRAGVSSFGFGGVNSHIVLEEYTPHITRIASEKQGPLIFVLSAKNQDRLRAYVQSMLVFLEKGDHPSLVDLVYTLQVGREEWNERLACVATDIDGLIRQLQAYLQNKPAREGIYTGTVKKKQAETEIDLAVDTPHSIAERWVNGSSVAWDQLYVEKPYRLSLPTYPFARERYWAVKGNKPNVIPTQFATPKEHLSERAGNDGKPANFFDVLPGSSSEVAVALPDIAQPGEETAGYVDELKRMLAGILKLDSDEIEADKDFTEYGVDSIVSSVIVQHVQEQYSISIQLSAVVEYPTLAEFAAFVADEVTSQRPGTATVAKTVKVQPSRQTVAKLPPELIPLNLGGHYHNSFWVHGGPGLAAFYTSLSQALGKDYPFYVFQAKGVDGKTMPRDFEEMVTHYMHCIRMVQPKGPYVIGGYSFGGLVAYEMAQRFILEGEQIAHLVIFDTFPCDPEANAIFYSNSDPHNAFFKLMMGNEFANARKNRTALILPKDLDGVHPYLHIAHIAKLAKERGKSPLNTEDIYNYIAGACRLNDYAGSTYDSYKPQPYSGSDVLYFKATDGFVGKDNWMGLDPYHVYGSYDYTDPWRKLVKRNLNIVEVPCDHFNILEEPSLSIVTKSVRSILS